MPVETTNYIDGLNTSWPAATDSTRQGDDHLRLIKSVLKNTFPKLTGPVDLTQGELNSLMGQSVPRGLVAMWYGTSETIPTGWALCDGGTYPRSDGQGTLKTPDLRDRFVMGAGTKYPAATTGGAATRTIETTLNGKHSHTTSTAGAHNHGGATGAHTLTADQIPPHRHATVKAGNSGSTLSATNTIAQETTAGGDTEYRLRGIDGAADLGLSGPAGGGQPHNHSIGSDGAHDHGVSEAPDHKHAVTVDTLPPYHALYFIMKL